MNAPHEQGALIERVAKALCRFRHTPRSVEEAVAPGRELWMRYIPDAEVAIAAMSSAPEGETIFAWMLDHPYDAMLAFCEATNVDTYGIAWRDAKPVREATPAEIRGYLKARFEQFMASSSGPQEGRS